MMACGWRPALVNPWSLSTPEVNVPFPPGYQERSMRRRRWASLSLKAAGLMLLLTAMVGTAQAGAGAPTSVPEIDPGTIIGAATLLGGGLLWLTDRRAK